MGSNKQIARNIFYSFLSYGINLLLSFFLTPYLITTVGKEAYSFFPLVNSMIGYTGIITASIGSMIGRYITMSYYGDDIEGAKGYFNSAMTAYIGLSAIFCIIGIFILIFIDNILTIPNGLTKQVQILFALSLLGYCINLCIGLLGIGTYVKNRLDLNSMVNLIKNIVYVIMLFVLFALFQPTIVYISIASFISVLVGVGFNTHFKMKFLPEITFQPKKYFSWKKIKTVLNSGIWMSINSLSSILTTTIDLFLTNMFISAAVTADFSISKTIPTFITTLSFFLFTSFTANFNILYAKKKYGELLHEIKKAMVIISFIISIPIGYFMVNSDYFFQLWVPSAYTPDMVWLSLIALVLSATGYSTNALYGVYTITDKRKIPTLVLLATGIANMTLVFCLLKFTNMGVYAIAISSAITLGLRNVIFTPIYGAKCLELRFMTFYPLVLKGFAGIAIVVIIGLIARQFMNHITWFTFIINAIVVCSFSFIANYYFFLKKEERTYLLSVVQNKLSFMNKH
ncbi:MAG: oligosaccharide flippase family protein [Prevotella sp.]|nr:oligosaccharide flippase family protein [Prevotella sp.]